MLHWKNTNDVFESFSLVGDVRTEQWPLVRSVWPTLLLSFSYLICIKFFTRWMEGRESINCNSFMIVYNFIMVIASAVMFVEFVYYGSESGLTIFCWSVNSKVTNYTMALASVFWWYYVSKIVEFLDTMFFIARRRFDLVTTLHVFHHMIMPFNSWLAIKFAPGGFVTVPFLLNCFVHIFMYTYYGLAAMGPAYKRYLFWKKYMTILQIAQFIFIFVHSIYFLRMDCKFPKVLVAIVLGNALTFLLMFSHFYKSSYTARIIPVKQHQ